MAKIESHKKMSKQIRLEESTPLPNVYCWICATGATNLRCSECKRCFHQKCVEKPSDIGLICGECSKGSEFERFDPKFIPNILRIVGNEKQFTSLKWIHSKDEQTTITLDLWDMKKKRYETVQQFEEDMKLFRHNCRSIYPKDCKIQAAAKELIEYVKDEIQTIRACEECYENTCEHTKSIHANIRKDIKQCSKLHLLVWAKSWGSSYSPAKVLTVNFDKETVIVQFFSDFSTSVLPMTHTNCYLYSVEHPGEDSNRKLDSKALKRTNGYIKYVRSEFGNFNFAKPNTIFEPERIDEYLQQMTEKRSTSGGDDNDKSSTSEKKSESVKATTGSDMRKRNNRTDSTSGPTAKRNRDGNVLDRLSNSMENASKKYIQGMKQVLGNLQNDLDKTRDEKRTLWQLIGELGEEKKSIKEKNMKLEGAIEKEKTKFDEAKKAFEEEIAWLKEEKKKDDEDKKALQQKNAALQEEHSKTLIRLEETHTNEMERLVGEKKALEAQITTFKSNITKKTCVFCHKDLDQLLFCNNDCFKHAARELNSPMAFVAPDGAQNP